MRNCANKYKNPQPNVIDWTPTYIRNKVRAPAKLPSSILDNLHVLHCSCGQSTTHGIFRVCMFVTVTAHTRTNFISLLLPPNISLFPLWSRMRLLCMSVRLYFEAKPVRSVICCCVFVYFLLACLPSLFPSTLSVWLERLPFGPLGPGFSAARLDWLILIKWSPRHRRGALSVWTSFIRGRRFTTADFGISFA